MKSLFISFLLLILQSGCSTSLPKESLSQPTKAKPLTHEQELDAFLKKHNEVRASVGVAPLEYDTALILKAQYWANYLDSIGDLKYRYRRNPDFEEVIFNGYGNIMNYLEGWESGKKEYETDTVPPPKIRHRKVDGIFIEDTIPAPPQTEPYITYNDFTRMAWSSTKRLGVGWAYAKDSTYWFVIYYSPRTNIKGQRPY